MTDHLLGCLDQYSIALIQLQRWYVARRLQPVTYAPLCAYPIFSSPILNGRRLDVYHTWSHDVALVRI